MRILVIGGGISPERGVSIKSADTVYQACRKKYKDTFFYDWDGSDDWLRSHGRNFDVAFPVLHGVGGEDGVIQTILEEIGLSYLGSSSSSSRRCIDKWLTKQDLISAGIHVPSGELVNAESYMMHPLSSCAHVIKLVDGGSSIGTHIVRNPDMSSSSLLSSIFKDADSVLIEELIQGHEITVSVIGDDALPVVEIIPPIDEEFDFENKYNGKTRELCPPINLSKSVQLEAQNLAIRVHKVMRCRHLSRVDMMISERGMYVLEINTMPGLTERSLFPIAWNAAGHSVVDMVERFKDLVING